MLEILNLGGGVQSSTLLCMSAFGELPRLDCAIFADTGWEPPAVYAHLAWLTDFAVQHGIGVQRVSCGRNTDGMRGQVFLHRSCVPLADVDLRNDFDRGQLPILFGDSEETGVGCDSGHCFV